MRGFVHLCAISFLFCVSGCATARVPVEGSRGALDRNFRVSVEADGRPVQDFEESLVHRVVLRPGQVRDALADWPRLVRLPLDLRPEMDQGGQLKGLRVSKLVPGTTLSDLGLRPGDVVTGVGLRPIREEKELGEIFVAVSNNKLVSLTFERMGKPHKTFYFAR